MGVHVGLSVKAQRGFGLLDFPVLFDDGAAGGAIRRRWSKTTVLWRRTKLLEELHKPEWPQNDEQSFARLAAKPAFSVLNRVTVLGNHSGVPG